MNILKRIILSIRNPKMAVICEKCMTASIWSFRENEYERPYTSAIWCPICGHKMYLTQEDLRDRFNKHHACDYINTKLV